MPNPEDLEGSDASREHPPIPYSLAARYRDAHAAGWSYFAAQETIYQAQCDLSVFRLIWERHWHVAVLGKIPPAEVDQTVRLIMAAGEAVTLPEDVLGELLARRARAAQQGPWIERHFRPGRPLHES